MFWMAKQNSFTKKRGKVSPLILIVVLVALFSAGAWIGFVSAPKRHKPTGPQMVVNFLNGNLGGGILISYPNHKLVLIDPGPQTCADDLISHLGHIKAENLTIVVTDTDKTAYGAMDSIVDTFSVSQVVYPEGAKGDNRWKTSLARINERSIQTYGVSEGDSIVFTKNSAMQVLSPIRKRADSDGIQKMVGRLVFGNISFMLASRLEPAEEASLVSAGHSLSSNILHVCSSAYDSTSLELLSQVRPEYCVVSSGNGSRRPSSSLLRRIDPLNTGADLLQSTRKSDAIIKTDGAEVSVSE
jgi:beta-lactamase superfamily II metal-dependent hydrolase